MIRVIKTEKAGRTTITVDGHLSGEYVEIVETCCTQALSSGAPVDLFVRDVSIVDQSGRDLLRRMAVKGLHLLAKGIYTSQLVRALASTEAEVLNRVATGNHEGQTKRQRP